MEKQGENKRNIQEKHNNKNKFFQYLENRKNRKGQKHPKDLLIFKEKKGKQSNENETKTIFFLLELTITIKKSSR